MSERRSLCIQVQEQTDSNIGSLKFLNLGQGSLRFENF